jgi:hypothetical protein
MHNGTKGNGRPGTKTNNETSNKDDQLTAGEVATSAKEEGISRSSALILSVSVVTLVLFCLPLSNLSSGFRKGSCDMCVASSGPSQPTVAPPLSAPPSPPLAGTNLPSSAPSVTLPSEVVTKASPPLSESMPSPTQLVGSSTSNGVCAPVQRALGEYLARLNKAPTESAPSTPATPTIVWRVLKADKSGLGSNLKGLISILAFGMAMNHSVVVETDCPEFSDFFDSPRGILDLRKGIGSRSPPLPRASFHCMDWIPSLQKGTFSLDLIANRVANGELLVLCDRHMLHHFPNNDVLRERFFRSYQIPWWTPPTATTNDPNPPQLRSLLTSANRDRPGSHALVSPTGGLHPALLFGCLFDGALTFKQDVLEKVASVLPLQPNNSSAKPDPTSALNVLGVQIRRGGRGVTWKDPGRFSKRQEKPIMNCITSLLKKHFEQSDSNKRLFLTTDSRALARQIQSLPFLTSSQVLTPYMPDVYVHTALSSAEETKKGDTKVVVDLASLMECDRLWITRSAFGEVPAWVAFSRRPNTFQMQLLLESCGIQDKDCSVEDC